MDINLVVVKLNTPLFISPAFHSIINITHSTPKDLKTLKNRSKKATIEATLRDSKTPKNRSKKATVEDTDEEDNFFKVVSNIKLKQTKKRSRPIVVIPLQSLATKLIEKHKFKDNNSSNNKRLKTDNIKIQKVEIKDLIIHLNSLVKGMTLRSRSTTKKHFKLSFSRQILKELIIKRIKIIISILK